MYRTFPIQLLWQTGTHADYIRVAAMALSGAISRLGLGDRIQVSHVGSLHDLNMDELFQTAQEEGRRIGLAPGQADICTVWRRLEGYVASKGQDASRLFLLASDDYSLQEPKEDWLFGYTDFPWSCTASTWRFMNDTRIKDRLGLFALMVMHEFGHLVNAADPKRGEALQQWLGTHCTNACVMRQKDDLPDFERDVLPDLNQGRLFCELCIRDVHSFMSSHAA